MYNVGNYQEASLSAQLGTSATTITIYPGATFVTPPALVILASGRELDALKSGEIVTVSGGSGTSFNITRTKPLEQRQTWPVGTLVLGNFFAEHIQEIQTVLDGLKWALLFVAGGSENKKYAIVRTNIDETANADFRVVPGASDLQVTVYGGLAVINREPVYRSNASPLSLLLPANETCGIYQHTDGTIGYVADYVPGTTYDDKMLVAVVTTPASGTISSGAIDDERIFF
jgi:hypothetical protein